VAQQMEFQAFHNLHSVYHDFHHCQPTFFKLSSCSTFVVHCLLTLPQLQRTSTPKTKNHHFFGDGWYCFLSFLLHHYYTISTNTHSQFLVNVYQRLLSICVLTTFMLLIYIIKYH